jgi:hypothetical protein
MREEGDKRERTNKGARALYLSEHAKPGLEVVKILPRPEMHAEVVRGIDSMGLQPSSNQEARPELQTSF